MKVVDLAVNAIGLQAVPLHTPHAAVGNELEEHCRTAHLRVVSVEIINFDRIEQEFSSCFESKSSHGLRNIWHIHHRSE